MSHQLPFSFLATLARWAGRAVLGFALLGTSAAAFAADAELTRLMALFAGQQEGEARFVERKYLAVLDQPVESSGTLRYRAPDRLERHTLKPHAESMVLEGNTLTLERGGQKRVVRLSDYPQVAPFVDSIRSTLAGDLAALERIYAVQLSGSLERWKLSLLPRDPQMAEVIVRITLAGARGELREVEILQADGDRSVMSIQQVGGR